MTDHVTTSKMELFCARGLPKTELARVGRHIANCSDCGRQFVLVLGSQKGDTHVSFTLAPEFWLRNQHIDYEQLVELADNKLHVTDRDLIHLHLKTCLPCQEDVRSFLAFREQIAPELVASYSPIERGPVREGWTWSSWWAGLAWKPIYAGAVVVIGIAIVIGVAFMLKRRAENLQAQQVPTPQGSPSLTPDNYTANVPSPPAKPNESPIEKPNNEKAIVVLNDRGGTITLDKNGNVAGLGDVPAPTRDDIAKVLLSERIEQPAILKDLAGQDSTLRGSNSRQSFKLISPSRTVIVSDRPTFKWKKVLGASTYRVYVNDPTGQEAARSEELSPERTEWVVSKSLKRGEIYAWTVIAVVDGKEIVSPGPSSPEMKFQILSMSNLKELNQLKRTRSHLALGVFYAKIGMIPEAEREFQELVRLNPNSTVLTDLLRSVRLLRGQTS